MKPIVIAGNGPSLKSIDYTRLPEDFDVFRCNQFYFEDKYFLGRKIKGAFFTPAIFKNQYFTAQHLRDTKQYEIEDIYCSIFDAFDKEDLRVIRELDYFFPNIKKVSSYLKAIPVLHQELKYQMLYYGKCVTSGILMILVAIAQGYKEIYLTGIDFYEGGGVDYAFLVHNKQELLKMIPEFSDKNFCAKSHSKALDLRIIKLVQEIEDIKIYSITPDSALSKIIPLADVKKRFLMQLESKLEGFTCDLLPTPSYSPKFASKLKQFGLTKDNIYVRLLLDLKVLLKAVIKAMLK